MKLIAIRKLNEIKFLKNGVANFLKIMAVVCLQFGFVIFGRNKIMRIGVKIETRCKCRVQLGIPTIF